MMLILKLAWQEFGKKRQIESGGEQLKYETLEKELEAMMNWNSQVSLQNPQWSGFSHHLQTLAPVLQVEHSLLEKLVPFFMDIFTFPNLNKCLLWPILAKNHTWKLLEISLAK